MRAISRSVCLLGLILFAGASAHAATFYVRNGGDDAADGRSHATAWATIARVNSHGFAPGDRVLLHEGDRWEEQLIVDWSGTAETPAIIGAYYMDNGVQTWGFATSRPVLDGDDRLPGGGAYDALIRVRGDRVRLEHLEVRNSEGRGIAFADSSYGEVIDCVTDGTYKSGINFLRSDDGRVMRNVVMHAGKAYPEDGGSWAGAIEFVDSDRGLVNGNTVAEVFGEGINANNGSTGTVIEANRVYAARAVGIYADTAPETTIRRNVVVGTADSTYWRTGDATGAGIAVNNEKYHYQGHGGSLPLTVQSENARIYGNLVAGTSSGIALWSALPETSHGNLVIFNNTLVDNNTQINGVATRAPGGRIINNVLASLSSGSRDVDSSNLNGATARNNYFSQGNPGGALSHAGNRYDGVLLQRVSGWRLIRAYDELDWQDFAPDAGSAVVHSGDDEPMQAAQGAQDYNLDFNRRAFDSPMDMGALRFEEISIRIPKSPSDVYTSR